MRRQGIGALVAVVLATAGLGACDRPDEFETGLIDRAAAPNEPGAIRVVERDVEAPEVFKAEEPGLWDGRPSLGGVWVAHPDVGEPERVLIRNEATGTFVIGALFRRERENPGPRLQVSSDAASALGILPGAPTALTVTALRRQETTEPAATPARQTAETQTARARPPAVQDEPARTAVASDAVETRALPTTADLAPRPTQPARPPATATATAQAPAAPSAPAAPRVETAMATAAAQPRMSARALAELTATAEEAIARTAPAPGPARSAATTTPAPRNVSAPAAATPPRAPAPAASSAAALDRPLVQIGIFSVQDNATRTARRMTSAGLPVNVLEEQSHGKTFWRVTLGPAANAEERGRLLARAREMGFADAYAVRR